MMRKKIAFVIGGLRGGGAEKVCVSLANGLAERGYSIDLVVLGLEGAIHDKNISKKVNLVDLKVNNARKSFLALCLYLKKSKPSTVLSFNRQISVVLAIVRKLAFLNFRLVSRNIIFLSIAESRKSGLWHGVISKMLIKKFYILSDQFIAQSHSMKLDMISYLGLPAEKVTVIHNPVHADISSLGVRKKKPMVNDYLLCVGRLEPQKAFNHALKAFSIVASEYPSLRLKIVGKGSLESSLKHDAQVLDVANRVDFEGYKDDMTPYYLGAKATLLTSLYEGFPNVLIESIALGTPVVSFDCPSGPNEIVIDGVNGFLVVNKSIDDLCVKIKKVLDNNFPTDEVRSTVDKFSIDIIINAYEEVL